MEDTNKAKIWRALEAIQLTIPRTWRTVNVAIKVVPPAMEPVVIMAFRTMIAACFVSSAMCAVASDPTLPVSISKRLKR